MAFETFAQSDTNAVPIVNVDIPDVPKSLQPKVPERDSNEIYDHLSIEVEPEFPGGMQKFYDFLGQVVVYPEIAKLNHYQGKVYVKFIIHEDGRLSDFQVIHGVHASLNEAAINALKLSPDWLPGEHMGKCVKTQCGIPILFIMDDSEPNNNEKEKRKSKRK